MYYWRNGQDPAHSAIGLLAQANGTCQAWADLFSDVLMAQGLVATMPQLKPTDMPDYQMMAIHTWIFVGDGTADLLPFVKDGFVTAVDKSDPPETAICSQSNCQCVQI
jgi:hypothetical protein